MARPLAFDPDIAVANIADVFWRKGYEGTSMQDIEAATGLNKQSLYRLYKDKRGMYLAALDHYDETGVGDGAYLNLDGLNAKERFQHFFMGLIDEVVKTGDRRGCFLCNASADQAQLDGSSRAQIEKMTQHLAAHFEEALRVSEPYRSDAELCRKVAMALLSGYVGLRIMIRANVAEEALRHAASALSDLISIDS